MKKKEMPSKTCKCQCGVCLAGCNARLLRAFLPTTRKTSLSKSSVKLDRLLLPVQCRTKYSFHQSTPFSFQVLFKTPAKNILWKRSISNLPKVSKSTSEQCYVAEFLSSPTEFLSLCPLSTRKGEPP